MFKIHFMYRALTSSRRFYLTYSLAVFATLSPCLGASFTFQYAEWAVVFPDQPNIKAVQGTETNAGNSGKRAELLAGDSLLRAEISPVPQSSLVNMTPDAAKKMAVSFAAANSLTQISLTEKEVEGRIAIDFRGTRNSVKNGKSSVITGIAIFVYVSFPPAFRPRRS
ncbi:MAG: hypothetical protein ACOYMS_12290 [Terrimicrobiaceae bacterium]